MPQAYAQEINTPSPAVPGIATHLWGNLSTGFYDPTQERWNWTGLSIVGATAATSYMLYRYADPSILSSSEGTVWEGGSKWSSYIGGYLPYALPVGFFAASRFVERGNPIRSELSETAEQLAEALGFTIATTMALKLSVGRSRPNGFNNRSFPSGHSSMAFASAGILAQRYPWYVGIPSYMAASAIAFSRLDKKMHYVSDVAAGAGIGLFFATAVHQYHRRTKRYSDGKQLPKQLLPMVADNTYGLSLFAHF